MEQKYHQMLQASSAEKKRSKKDRKKQRRKTIVMQKIVDIAQNNPVALGGFLSSLGSKIDFRADEPTGLASCCSLPYFATSV